MHLNSHAQGNPVWSEPSPEVATLGLYGSIPISYYTGQPNISIPLYEIKAGDYTLPITASYHLSSVKPHTQPGPLGIGWSMNAGGFISRTVRGVYDEKKFSNGHAQGFYWNADKMKNITQPIFGQHTESYTTQPEATGGYELSADEFSFSFCGYTGNFYYNCDGGWTVISDDDIKVVFDPDSGFASFSDISYRFVNTNNWGLKSHNDCFFKSFTLITPDGCRYVFGGEDAMEFSISYYNRDKSDLIATSWRLSKIITPQGHEILFFYDTSSVMCDLQYVPQTVTINNRLNNCIGRKGLTGFLLFPVNLSQIISTNEQIDFRYYTNRHYSKAYANSSFALYWSERNGMTRPNIYSDENDPALQFNKFISFTGSTNNEVASYIANNILTHKLLHRIEIRKGNENDNKCIYFKYVGNARKKLSLITEREGVPALQPNYYTYYGVVYMEGYKIPLNQSNASVPTYRFEYNSDDIPESFLLPCTDKFGYYNGKTISFSDNVETMVQKETVNKNATIQGTLKAITYPTGGQTVFTYELNSSSANVALIPGTQTGILGGLRVQEIKNVDREGNLVERKEFLYVQGNNSSTNSSGVSHFKWCNSAGYYNDTFSVSLLSSSSFFPSVTNRCTPIVGYSRVIERLYDKRNQPCGYTVYRYSNNENVPDELPLFSYNANGTSVFVPYSTHSAILGKLLSKEIYDVRDSILQREIYTYKTTQHQPFLSASQQQIIVRHEGEDYHSALGWVFNTYTYSYLPDSVIIYKYERERPFEDERECGIYTQSTKYTYDHHRLLTSETTLSSHGPKIIKIYRHPYDVPEYNWMESLNILKPIVETIENIGTTWRSERRIYAQNMYLKPFLQSISRATSNDTIPHLEYEVLSTDKYGNPLEIRRKGENISIIWDNNGQVPLGVVENALYAELPHDSINPYTISLMPSLEACRMCPRFHVTEYFYDARLNLIQKRKPNGLSVFYSYDFLDRLTEEYYYINGEKNIIKKYDYFYYDNHGTDIFSFGDDWFWFDEGEL